MLIIPCHVHVDENDGKVYLPTLARWHHHRSRHGISALSKLISVMSRVFSIEPPVYETIGYETEAAVVAARMRQGGYKRLRPISACTRARRVRFLPVADQPRQQKQKGSLRKRMELLPPLSYPPLDEIFKRNERPEPGVMESIAKNLGLEFSVVVFWYVSFLFFSSY
jgi:hypothetical protein